MAEMKQARLRRAAAAYALLLALLTGCAAPPDGQAPAPGTAANETAAQEGAEAPDDTQAGTPAVEESPAEPTAQALPSTIGPVGREIVLPEPAPNAPSDADLTPASREDATAFIEMLAVQPHYDPARLARYFAYYGSSWQVDQIVRIVNTDNDLRCFVDAVSADTSRGALILVNKYHVLDEDYVPDDLVRADSANAYSGQLTAETNEAFHALATAIRAETGLRVICASPYRSYLQQKALYVKYARASGAAAADSFSARPGYSEHQAGVALDLIVPGGELRTFEQTAQFAWMCDNAHRFGFILRYGAQTKYITGYEYEPWHYRYVGVDAATVIHEQGLTLEEYYAYYVLPDGGPEA